MINIKLYSENRRILQIAIPSIISNITVPLLGLIDVTIVGHLGSPAYIGAIAVGGMLFNIIYWIFGFLRMGTSGMTSQAYGQHDLNEITRYPESTRNPVRYTSRHTEFCRLSWPSLLRRYTSLPLSYW